MVSSSCLLCGRRVLQPFGLALNLLAVRSVSSREFYQKVVQRCKKRIINEKSMHFEDSEFGDMPIAAQKLIKPNVKHISDNSAPQKLSKSEDLFPFFHITTSSSSNFEPVIKSLNTSDVGIIERGFFVEDEKLVDEYTAAFVDELPEDEYSDEIELSHYHHLPIDGAVENIQFQMPGQETHPKKTTNIDRVNNKSLPVFAENENTSNDRFDEENTKVSSMKCAGCGGFFHCQNPSLPGFLPVGLFENVEREEKKPLLRQRTNILCRRCHLYKKYNFLLNVSVCKVDYEGIMSHLKLLHEALILLVVDMSDLNGSICKNLPKIIGENKPMIVIGNKVDLLPPDTEFGYLKHYRQALNTAVHDAGFFTRFNVLKCILTSAKTGYGVEDLINNIFLKWIGPRGVLRGDIYVLGCTNAGKSTLFNSFLQSDLCKVRALDLVEKVTTSCWPGTTLSLLKFPVMNPTPFRMELRRRRLLSMQTWMKKERAFLSALRNESTYLKPDLRYQIENSMRDIEEENQPRDSAREEFYGLKSPYESLDLPKKISLNSVIFNKGHWCFDTPGTVNDDQLLNSFTLEELIHVLPRSTIMPRIFIVKPGQSILVGAVARVDVLENGTNLAMPFSVYLTVFASKFLPVHVMHSNVVNEFLQNYSGTSVLKAPLGSPDRLAKFPKLEKRCLIIENDEVDDVYQPPGYAISDVCLSSIGWLMISSGLRPAHKINIAVWTPAGRGIVVRKPPLVPFAFKYRGSRIPGSSAYKTLSFDKLKHAARESSPHIRFDLED